MRLLTYALVLGGCANTFDLAYVDKVWRDAGASDTPDVPDALLDAPPPPPCMTAAVQDHFTTDPPCGAWGMVNAVNAQVAVSSGELGITTSTSTGYGQCVAVAPAPLDARGVFAEVLVIGGDAWVGVTFNTTDFLVVYSDGTYLTFGTRSGGNIKAIGYVATAMRWWRVRPDSTRDVFVGEYSADGLDWVAFAEGKPIALDTDVRVFLGGGANNKAPPRKISFERLGFCP